MFDISGKVALITGGSRGLGLQMAEAIGKMGCKVAITARKQIELDGAAANLSRKGIEVMTVAGDMSKLDGIPAMVDLVLAKYGSINILVNNAGTTWSAPAENHPLDAWHNVINLNVTAMFVISQYVAKRVMIPAMSGKIINIGSIWGLLGGMPDVTTVAYKASKGAVVNLTRALATEWGKFNINVNAICPGVFPSKITYKLIETWGEALVAKTPLHRLGGEEDLKGTVVFLASAAARHIIGQYIVVDGGASIT